MEVRLAHPAGYAPESPGSSTRATELAGGVRRPAVVRHDPVDAVRGAAVVYTDAWTSMGQEAEAEARRDAFAGFQVDDALLDAAGPDVVAMHCLPAHRGEEITSAVMDGPRSLIWEQSENRLHVQKALLVGLLDGTRRRMSEELYERYKDALRRGHVAAVRGRLDVAEAAYREAAADRARSAAAPRRPRRRPRPPGRTDEALAAYAAALDRAPTDEAALRGRADVLAAAGRPRRGSRHPRPAGRDPRTRRPPGRRLRRRPTRARACRVARSAPASSKVWWHGCGSRDRRHGRRRRPSHAALGVLEARSPARPIVEAVAGGRRR